MPTLFVLSVLAVFWVVCSVSIVEIAVAFVAMPEISWSPVLVPSVFVSLKLEVESKLILALLVVISLA